MCGGELTMESVENYIGDVGGEEHVWWGSV
jgi:hypothetical protein